MVDIHSNITLTNDTDQLLITFIASNLPKVVMLLSMHSLTGVHCIGRHFLIL